MFEQIFTDIIARRGGEAAFTPASLAVARTLAGLLANPSADPATARTMIDLEKLLPQPVADGEADLSKLDDSELGVLDVLLRKARGIEPDAPIDLEAMAPEQFAKWREAEAEREALERTREEREQALRERVEWLEAEWHAALVKVDELTRRVPSVVESEVITTASASAVVTAPNVVPIASNNLPGVVPIASNNFPGRHARAISPADRPG